MHGWLQHEPLMGWEIEGVHVSPATRTRNVEYAWAADELAGINMKTLLDAASGYVPTWHVLPEIARRLGYTVEAIDMNELSLKMPTDALLTRTVGDITNMPYADHSFDVVSCISVLEHLDPTEQALAVREICRIARRYVIITADDAPWLPILFAPYLHLGEQWAFNGDHLNPPVYALIGTPRHAT